MSNTTPASGRPAAGERVPGVLGGVHGLGRASGRRATPRAPSRRPGAISARSNDGRLARRVGDRDAPGVAARGRARAARRRAPSRRRRGRASQAPSAPGRGVDQVERRAGRDRLGGVCRPGCIANRRSRSVRNCERVEDRVHRLAVPRLDGEVVGAERQLDVGEQLVELAVEQHLVEVRAQRLPRLALDLVGVREDALEAAVRGRSTSRPSWGRRPGRPAGCRWSRRRAPRGRVPLAASRRTWPRTASGVMRASSDTPLTGYSTVTSSLTSWKESRSPEQTSTSMPGGARPACARVARMSSASKFGFSSDGDVHRVEDLLDERAPAPGTAPASRRGCPCTRRTARCGRSCGRRRTRRRRASAPRRAAGSRAST